MKAGTRKKFNRMCADMASTYGVESVSENFSIEPTHAQTFKDKVVEQSSFLQKINTIFVDDLTGENIFGSVAGPVSSRTDTSGDGERSPRDFLKMENAKYELIQTDFDYGIRWRTIDVWAKFPDLVDRYTGYVFKQRANDIELAGWYGVKREATTSIDANPNLEDLHKGWLQYMREVLPGNIILEGNTPGEIRIGPGGDYLTLDLAVEDLKNGIPDFLQEGLVAMVGSDLISRERVALFRAVAGKPSEKILYDNAMSTFGGLPWDVPSNFPRRGLVVTSYDNISYYQQEGTQRRHIIDNPKKSRVEDYNSTNDGYTVESPRKFMGLDFIKVKLPVYDANGEITGWD